MEKNSSYYMSRMENMLNYMDKNNIYDKNFYMRVIGLEDDLRESGLNNDIIKWFEEYKEYFLNNIYQDNNDTVEREWNVWSKFKE